MNIEFTPAFCYAMAFAAVLIATISQILLKRQANTTGQNKSGFIWKFLNVRVIVSYGLLFLSLALNQVALICVPVSVLPCITATSFIWIFLFSAIFLHERPSKRKIWALSSSWPVFPSPGCKKDSRKSKGAS